MPARNCFKALFSFTGVLISIGIQAQTTSPSIKWATYFGGTDYTASFSTDIRATAIDKDGNVYAIGRTDAASGISTPGTYQPVYSGNISGEGFIVKFNRAGIKQWATYFGDGSLFGSLDASGVACDSKGNVFVTGIFSENGLSTPGSFQPDYAGGGDCFLMKLDPAGVRVWSTYFGGTSSESSCRVACDKDDNILLSGFTYSSDLPVTAGCYQPARGGQNDGFLAKFNNAGLCQWSTYYGGDKSDGIWALTTDKTGNIYISGNTSSTNSISSAGTHQVSLAGPSDAFVSKFSPAGVRVWGTYYGGESLEECKGIGLDGAGNVYLAGITSSTTGIATAGVHSTTKSDGQDGFVASLTATGTRRWGSYYGGLGYDRLQCLAVDEAGTSYAAGETYATGDNYDIADGIATPDAHQQNYGGGYSDGILAVFDSNGQLDYGTYYGGNKDELIPAISYNNGTLCLGGYTSSASGVATPGSYQAAFLGPYNDGFLVKFYQCLEFKPVVTLADNELNTTEGYSTYNWFLNNIAVSGANQSAFTPSVSGLYTVQVTNAEGCTGVSTPFQVYTEPNLFVPNIFSPNGDGKNDLLQVYGNNLDAIRLTIYNQWGQKIYETSDIHGGWNGFAGGKLQPVGVYVYTLRATLYDGRVIDKKGSFSLIR